MSASETFWEGDSPQFAETDNVYEVDFPQRELLLKRKVVLLEEFARNGGMEPRSVEDRCKILQQRIDALEGDLSQSGNLDSARRYIEHAPQSDFDAINRDEFMAWFARGQRPRTIISRPDRNILVARGRGATHVAEDSSHRDGSRSGMEAVHRPKRRRIAEKETPPCLRCKILKKRCDSLEHCSHCPEQSFESGLDFWKVLGCFREPLRGLSSVFCPHFSRSTRRILRLSKGGTEIVNLLLIKSKVSKQKRGRILNLICNSPQFVALEGSSWEDITKRQSLAFASASFEQLTEDHVVLNGEQIYTEDYEAPWAILQTLSMDAKYLTPTEYNFFTLIGQGNKISKLEPDSWDLYIQAKQILRQSVEIFLLERLCSSIASGDMKGPPPFFRSATALPNTLVLVDVKGDLEKFLSDFEAVCSGRAKLTGHSQLACFYALLVFGIAKSMLIDTYSIRAEYDNENPWKDTDAVSIMSAYKTLVSCFCWSSKTDMVFENGYANHETAFGNAIQDTRVMIHQKQWKARNYRSTKDFLLGLGTGFLAGEKYNGFLVQKYGIDTLPTSPQKIAATFVTEDYRGSDNGIQAPSSSPTFSTKTNRSAGEGPETSAPSISAVEGIKRISVSNILCAPQVDQGPQGPSILPAEPVQGRSDALTRSPSNFIFVQNDVANRERRRHGGRTGALNEDTLKRSREIRKLGSCWNCWIIRMACSEGTPCDRCLRLQGPEHHTCSRTSFSSYADTLFPDNLVAEYSVKAINDLSNDGREILTNQLNEIEITWCSGIATRLGARVYLPTDTLQRGYESREGHPLAVKSLPIGIAKFGSSIVGETCLTWLEHGLIEPENSLIGFGYQTSDFSKAVLASIISLNRSIQTENTLLHNFSTAYLALHAVSRPILLTEISAKSIRDKFKFGSYQDTIYSSRLLNLQLKHGMLDIARRNLTEGLSQLDKVFRDRDKTIWTMSFAGSLLLCLCLEQLQVLLNNYEHAQNPAGLAVTLDPSKAPQPTCHAIEAGLFTQIFNVFHLRYRTKKKDSSGLNPMRADFANTPDVGFAESDMSFIHGVRNLLWVNGAVLQRRDGPLDQSGTGNDFAQRNSGRLVAKFLLSFIEQEDGQRA